MQQSQPWGIIATIKLDYTNWAERINNSPHSGEHWGKLFDEHPEFFRTNPEDRKASLVWRRQFPKRYDPKRSTEIGRDEFDLLSPEEKNKMTRRPLEAPELTALINVAVDLHERALEQQKDKRWWLPIATACLAFLGALLGTWLGVK